MSSPSSQTQAQDQAQTQAQDQAQTPPSPPTAIPTPNPPPPIIQALSYSPLKKPQPLPWSHEETLNLIKAYQEKWYSLKRGQLKASQWEEVAITVAARCGLDDPSKSGTQCRHKIEKLRKRYRSEKSKLPPNFNYHTHPWIYFCLMDQLERGPMPISAVAPQPKIEDVDDSDDEVDLRFASLRNLRADNSRDFDNNSNRVDGFSRIGRNLGDFGNGYVRGSEFEGGNFKKRKNYNNNDEEDEDEVGYEVEDDDDDQGQGQGQEEMVDDKGRNLVGELGAQIRDFAEKFVKIEKKKLDLMRENERFRIEMENKRMEMIYVSQQKTVELINKAFDVAASSQKKMKMDNPKL
ncbi:Trihelix transcription factor ASIL2 [Bienertia sinuspersici]